jgi:dihydrofolate reductase
MFYTMKVIMVMVSSANGKITKGDDPDVSSFASREDAIGFQRIRERHRCYIMGSNTFEVSRSKLVLRKGKLRVVMTRHPDKYATEAVPGRLEFTAKDPKAILTSLASRGYKTVLLLGGGTVNTLFLQQGLVSELHLTIEPALFGSGKPLLLEQSLYVDLRLHKLTKLNSRGTLYCIYKVIT